MERKSVMTVKSGIMAERACSWGCMAEQAIQDRNTTAAGMATAKRRASEYIQP